ncbi:group III truncated hemoglobin [Dyella sp. 2RAB6]|uniref:group III truncated hemoglobin n=1 Tax=Dyella sp. 2RAB6 TaxID=3232992 RepID=UPI003F92EE0E
MERSASIDESSLALLVERFYDKVRADPALGPIFNAAVHDWDQHLRTLVSFWSSVALGTQSYRGSPMSVHRQQPIRGEHFDRWLELWRETVRELFEEAAAMRMIGYAERIGSSLRMGLGLHERRGAKPLGIPIVNQ